LIAEQCLPKAIYEDKDKTLFHGLYNDDHPDSGDANSNDGHTKGVVVFGQKQVVVSID
jgi:hypothetical protein